MAEKEEAKQSETATEHVLKENMKNVLSERRVSARVHFILQVDNILTTTRRKNREKVMKCY